MSGVVRTWVDGDGAYVEARFRADKGGVREAQAAATRLGAQGYVVVKQYQTGGHVNATKSVGKSLLGLGLLGATGFGFVGTSRDPGEIVVVFRKPVPQPQGAARQPEPAPARAELEAASRAAGRVALGAHPELAPEAVRGLVSIERSEPIPNGVRLRLLVANNEPEPWQGFELEAVVYRLTNGSTMGTHHERFSTPLESHRSARTWLTLAGLTPGDGGVLVGVTRVLIDGRWREGREPATEPLTIQGFEAERDGRIDDAIACYERSVARAEPWPTPYTRLAELYRRQGRFDDAVRVLETQLERWRAAGSSTTAIERRLATARKRADAKRGADPPA
jgi:hypothetical protein